MSLFSTQVPLFLFLVFGLFWMASRESSGSWRFEHDGRDIVVENGLMGERILVDGQRVRTRRIRVHGVLQHHFYAGATPIQLSVYNDGLFGVRVRADIVTPVFDSKKTPSAPKQLVDRQAPVPAAETAITTMLAELSTQPDEVKEAAHALGVALEAAKADLARAERRASVGWKETAQARMDEVHTMIQELHFMATECATMDPARSSFASAKMKLAAIREVSRG